MDIVTILFTLGLFVLGLYLLIKGSDIFVDGAAGIALKLGASEHLIGITLVALATSLPELAASSTAALQNVADLALGNVVGSNIANICLVLGTAAMLMRLEPTDESARDAKFMNYVALILAVAVFINFDTNALPAVSRWEGAAFLVIYATYIIYISRRLKFGVADESGTDYWKHIVYVIIGFVAITGGAYMLVHSAKQIALWFSVSTVIIGLTIVAFGTSIPELATSVAAAVKNKSDISIGNVLGSNIINVLLVLGVASVIAPDPIGVTKNVMYTTIPLLLFVSFLAYMFTRRRIGKVQGIFLLTMYALFIYGLNVIVF